jgi:hypothetical protein
MYIFCCRILFTGSDKKISKSPSSFYLKKRKNEAFGFFWFSSFSSTH